MKDEKNCFKNKRNTEHFPTKIRIFDFFSIRRRASILAFLESAFYDDFKNVYIFYIRPIETAYTVVKKLEFYWWNSDEIQSNLTRNLLSVS